MHSKKVEGGGVLSASVSSDSGMISATPIGDDSVAAASSTCTGAAVRLLMPARTAGVGDGRRKALAAPASSSVIIPAAVAALDALRMAGGSGCYCIECGFRGLSERIGPPGARGAVCKQKGVSNGVQARRLSN